MRFKREDAGFVNDFHYEIVMTSMGTRNGYLLIPKGHVWYGVHYENIDAYVHGWLTYADYDDWDGDQYWRIGFDTAHYDDASDPAVVAQFPGGKVLFPHGKIRTKEYVLEELESLSRQAIKVTEEEIERITL